MKDGYDAWKAKVDAIVAKKIGFGVTTDDLPDCCLMDWYEDGIKPATAANMAIKNANE